MVDHFRNEPVGTLVGMVQEQSGTVYSIWFPYTRGFIKQIREGDKVAVRGFASREGADVYTILEIMSVLPTHYALGDMRNVERAFPGFVVEAAKSAREDWEQVTSIEDTTKIKAEAIPIGIQLRVGGGSAHTEADESMPMLGEDIVTL